MLRDLHVTIGALAARTHGPAHARVLWFVETIPEQPVTILLPKRP
jgi:hypothetical protein